MKRVFLFILAAAMLLSGCSDTSVSISSTMEGAAESADVIEDVDSADVTASAVTTTEQPVSEETSEPTPETAETTEPVEEKLIPLMDGSTSAIPLEAGLRAERLGISYTEAMAQVEHNKTHISFQRLLDGETDLIFTVPISEEQQRLADEAGVKLISVPVAKEGFVFVVNKDNPVESLTQQQIRDIYSGRITNWNEIGGNDAEIIPYQRNLDSGSQNYMVEFMGDTPLTEARTELYVTGMGGLMDRIALYDNSVNAIGYSVYSYAAQMYANDNEVKFIAVDGVAPAKETMADDSYPLCSRTYIMYTDKADDITREFTDWVASDEGQLCVLRSGYLPVNGMEIPAEYMPYSAVGTGKPKPADYAPSELVCNASVYGDDFYGTRDGGYYYIKGLADDKFEEQINADIKAAQDYIMQFAPDTTGWTDSYMKEMCELSVTMECSNGFLSILFRYWSSDVEDYNPMSEYTLGCYDHAVSLVYDLVEQKRITEFSDLFYDGEDFVPMMNNAFAEHADMYLIDTELEKKSDFSGLLGDVEVFTLSGVCLNENNSYFDGMPLLSFSHCDPIKDSMIVWEYRDCTGVFENNVSLYNYEAQEYVYEYYKEGDVSYVKIESSRFHSDEEIAELNDKYVGMQEAALEYFNSLGLSTYSLQPVYDERTDLYYIARYRYEMSETVYFDGDTCKLLTPEELLCENWRDYFSEEIREDITFMVAWTGMNIDPEFVTVYALCLVRNEFGEAIDAFRCEFADIPLADVNPKYFSLPTE